MNHRETSQVPTGLHRIGVCWALLFAVATTETMRAMGHPRPAASRPSGHSPNPADGYLPLLGAPALRFAEELPLLAPTPRPDSIAPLKAAAIMTGPDIIVGKSAAPNNPASAARRETKADPAGADRTSPLAILPDENRPQVRPEDFLPYFQIPGVARVITESAPLPKSSATYTETPR